MISVCMATYNGERFIKEQLDSILHQLQTGDEIVISDDGSTDHTIEIITSMNSDKIRIYYNEGEHGYTPNFENALRHAKGDIIFLSDQDDLWKANKVATCLNYFESYDFIVSDAELINAEGQKTASSFYALRRSKPGLLQCLLRFSFLGCCIAFKRDILDRALPFPANHIYCTHDNWLTLIAMAFYKAAVVPDKLIGYRRYDNNTSSGGLKQGTTLQFKLQYRLYLIYWLLKRWALSAPAHKDNKPADNQ